MQPGGAFDDGQAQASSARIAACGFRPDERTLHRFALRVRNACAAICHTQHDCVRFLAKLHGDLAAAVFLKQIFTYSPPAQTLFLQLDPKIRSPT